MAEKLHNPLPDPVLKPHKQLEFDLPDEEVREESPEEKTMLLTIDPEDDFDIKISEEDDFDI